MLSIPSDDEFDEIISEALDTLPQKYVKQLTNVAIVIADEPTLDHLAATNLSPRQTLLGLYQGVPLPQRGGRGSMLPDKITLFKLPLAMVSHDEADFKQRVRHTLWHEMAHYFGLNHQQIAELE